MKRKLIASLLALALFISPLFVTGCSKRDNSIAPDFTIRVVGGGGEEWYDKIITLSKLRGRPVVIHFTASWCNICKHIFHTLKSYDNKNVFVMGIGVLDRKKNIIDYVMAQRFPVPVGYDEGGIITGEYHVNTLPLTVFIDKEGRITEKVMGMVSDETLEEAIKKIL
ncbi:MAG: TlpA family protein disulfide reductase [Deltaproteobacteria bacterium]|nr:TlpA family protein disulfide reductase [Deltaproteobacteria bacterium]